MKIFYMEIGLNNKKENTYTDNISLKTSEIYLTFLIGT